MRSLALPLTLLMLALCVYLTLAGNHHGADVEDNDFAEFEDAEDDTDDPQTGHSHQSDKPQGRSEPKVIMAPEADIDDADIGDDDEDDVTVEDEDEFEHFEDDEEFEGFDKEKAPKGRSQERPMDITPVTLPAHLLTNWDSFYMEMLMLAGLSVYLINFLAGKAKNGKLSTAWLSAHRTLLEDNFCIVGDDGTSTEVQNGVLMKESENVYSLWCSGRVCCEGMLVTLKLLKRQDLISTISQMFKPVHDQIIVKVTMDASEMDTFVLCLGSRKVVSRLQKDMVDLTSFCPDKKKPESFGLPSSFQILSEINEATTSVLDGKMVAALNKFESMIDYIHFSDQYSGAKQQDDTQTSKMPETSKVIIFAFNVPGKSKCSPSDMEAMKPLLMMVFHCMDKVKKVRLSRESKLKAEKNRQRLSESYSKASHTQRSEAAQERREKKKRAEKEKMMAEDDPDKQRKLEAREDTEEGIQEEAAQGEDDENINITFAGKDTEEGIQEKATQGEDDENQGHVKVKVTPTKIKNT